MKKFLLFFFAVFIWNNTIYSQTNFPEGTPFPYGKNKLNKLPEGFSAVASWCEAVTSKKDQSESTEAVVIIDYIKVIAKNRSNGEEEIVQSMDFDNLDEFWGNLYNREPKWFQGVDGDKIPMDNFELNNGTLIVNANRYPKKITHFGMNIISATNDYEYIVEVKTKIKGEVFFNIGLDAWKHDQAEWCGDEKCNKLMKYSKWYGDSNGKWIIVRTDQK